MSPKGLTRSSGSTLSRHCALTILSGSPVYCNSLICQGRYANRPLCAPARLAITACRYLMLPLPSRLMGALPSAPLHHRQRRHSTANGQQPTVQRLPGSVPCCPSSSPPAPLPVSSSHLGCLPPLRLGEQPFWDGIPSVACCSRDTRLCSKDSACNSLLLGIQIQLSPRLSALYVQCCAALRCAAMHCTALRCTARNVPREISSDACLAVRAPAAVAPSC